MHRTLGALLASSLLASAAVLAAQTPTTTAQSPTTTTADKFDSKEITITGCVEKTKSGGYFLMASSPAGTTTPTGTSGSTATTTGTPATPPTTTGGAPSPATTTDAAGKAAGQAWNLGQSDKLEQYVGKRVQVIGRPDKDTSGDQVKGTTGSGEIKARDFDVKSVSIVSSSCR